MIFYFPKFSWVLILNGILCAVFLLPQIGMMVKVAHRVLDQTGWCLNCCGGISSGNLTEHTCWIHTGICVSFFSSLIKLTITLLLLTWCFSECYSNVSWLFQILLSGHLYCSCHLLFVDSLPRNTALQRKWLKLLQPQLALVPLLRSRNFYCEAKRYCFRAVVCLHVP